MKFIFIFLYQHQNDKRINWSLNALFIISNGMNVRYRSSTKIKHEMNAFVCEFEWVSRMICLSLNQWIVKCIKTDLRLMWIFFVCLEVFYISIIAMNILRIFPNQLSVQKIKSTALFHYTNDYIINSHFKWIIAKAWN